MKHPPIPPNCEWMFRQYPDGRWYGFYASPGIDHMFDIEEQHHTMPDATKRIFASIGFAYWRMELLRLETLFLAGKITERTAENQASDNAYAWIVWGIDPNFGYVIRTGKSEEHS